MPKASKGTWLIWGGGAAVMVAILAIALVISVRHASGSSTAASPPHPGQRSSGAPAGGSLSPVQICDSDVEPVSYEFDTDFMQLSQNPQVDTQLADAYGQAAQRASSDQQIALDLNAEAADLRQYASDVANFSPDTESAWTQTAQEGNALLSLCQPEAATWPAATSSP